MGQSDNTVVGMASDRWSPRKNHNGVVSYTANIVEGMRRAGARVYVVANQVQDELVSEFVRPLPEWSESGTPLRRMMSRIGRRIAPGVHPRQGPIRLPGSRDRSTASASGDTGF